MSDDIGSTIHKELSKTFKNVKIVRVETASEIDFDGDEILRVRIIFEGKPKDLDSELLVGAYRYVSPVMDKFDTDEFPLISFISIADADRRAALQATH